MYQYVHLWNLFIVPWLCPLFCHWVFCSCVIIALIFHVPSCRCLCHAAERRVLCFEGTHTFQRTTWFKILEDSNLQFPVHWQPSIDAAGCVRSLSATCTCLTAHCCGRKVFVLKTMHWDCFTWWKTSQIRNLHVSCATQFTKNR